MYCNKRVNVDIYSSVHRADKGDDTTGADRAHGPTSFNNNSIANKRKSIILHISFQSD